VSARYLPRPRARRSYRSWRRLGRAPHVRSRRSAEILRRERQRCARTVQFPLWRRRQRVAVRQLGRRGRTAGEVDDRGADDARAAGDLCPCVASETVPDRRRHIEREQQSVRGIHRRRPEAHPDDFADRFAVEPHIGAVDHCSRPVGCEIQPLGRPVDRADAPDDQHHARGDDDRPGDDQTGDQCGPVDRSMQCRREFRTRDRDNRRVGEESDPRGRAHRARVGEVVFAGSLYRDA